MKKKKKKKFSFQKRNKKKVLKNETIYSYALACFTKYAETQKKKNLSSGSAFTKCETGEFEISKIHKF